MSLVKYPTLYQCKLILEDLEKKHSLFERISFQYISDYAVGIDVIFPDRYGNSQRGYVVLFNKENKIERFTKVNESIEN